MDFKTIAFFLILVWLLSWLFEKRMNWLTKKESEAEHEKHIKRLSEIKSN